ncbi:hypothetical protein [Bdellovibrio sp. HCB288]|uniref:hypothetical protein n=1 Tax=Bdellovibrio sp. HCB288 TaxID=3394355 RepID=UPI0039B69339
MKSALVLLLTVFALKSHAMVLFEPMAAYEVSGSTAIEFTPAGEAIKGVSKLDGTHSGSISYGARLGWVFDNAAWFAGEYMAASGGKIKYDTHEDEFTRESYGMDLGMWLGRWNLWVGYNIGDKLNITQQGATEKDEITGTAIRAGIGFLVFRHLAINVEGAYRTYNDGKSETDTVYDNMDQYVDKFNQTTVTAGLSFPF